MCKISNLRRRHKMADYKWNIDKVTTIPFFGGQYNVVSNVEWHMTATAGRYTTDYYGASKIPTDDLTDFIPYDQLNNDHIAEWLESAVDVPWLKSCLDYQLQLLQKPTTVVQQR